MRAAVLLGVALNALTAHALSPTPTVVKRHNNFVSTSDGKFHLGGKCVQASPLRFVTAHCSTVGPAIVCATGP